MQTAIQALNRALTATSAQQTTERVVNIEAWKKWAGFETFGDPQLERMLASVARFVLDMREGKAPRWLSLLGTSGSGKTMLAKRVWKWFRESPLFETTVPAKGEPIYPGQFCYWPTLADHLKGNQGYERLDDLKREKFIVVDDLGQSRDASGHITEKLSVLLGARVGKWTLITANLSVEEISQTIDTRLASRMIRDGSIAVGVDVADYSLRIK